MMVGKRSPILEMKTTGKSQRVNYKGENLYKFGNNRYPQYFILDTKSKNNNPSRHNTSISLETTVDDVVSLLARLASARTKIPLP
jgi:hypothetical protein